MEKWRNGEPTQRSNKNKQKLERRSKTSTSSSSLRMLYMYHQHSTYGQKECLNITLLTKVVPSGGQDIVFEEFVCSLHE